jgi:hypothetical protein
MVRADASLSNDPELDDAAMLFRPGMPVPQAQADVNTIAKVPLKGNNETEAW